MLQYLPPGSDLVCSKVFVLTLVKGANIKCCFYSIRYCTVRKVIYL